MRTLQEFTDAVVLPEMKQPLKTVEDACAAVGWEFEEFPVCCGKRVDVANLIGAYHAECKICGRFIHDMTGPSFPTSGSVQMFQWEQFPENTDWSRTWISGLRVGHNKAKTIEQSRNTELENQ